MPPVPMSYSSIVLFEDNLLAIETHPFEDRANVIHHGLQTAYVYIQVAPLADHFEQMELHVPGPADPGRFRATQRRQETEVGMLLRERLEIVAIINSSLVPRPE